MFNSEHKHIEYVTSDVMFIPNLSFEDPHCDSKIDPVRSGSLGSENTIKRISLRKHCKLLMVCSFKNRNNFYEHLSVQEGESNTLCACQSILYKKFINAIWDMNKLLGTAEFPTTRLQCIRMPKKN